MDTLSLFHPIVRQWFTERVGAPTDIQERAWPEIARGKHVLVTAPTGSGKTLTAFLWAINGFLTGEDTGSGRRVLYISPLKALNNDILRNLQQPLEELRTYFESAGKVFPCIQTAVRSGDTDYAERRSMIRRPPEILITTPESLNILLSSKSGLGLLHGISTVILDEIHAVAPTKRGTYLMTAVERLVPLCGEFQRIALSATVRPLDTVADFIGGFTAHESSGVWLYEKRPVEIIESRAAKDYAISVNYPETGADPDHEKDWWRAITESLKGVIAGNRSTLLFANSRRMVEKIARLINENEETDRVYSHHGSLSKEIRTIVEKRLKAGELPAIIATSSLELGIDIGSVDEVVLIQTPYSIASAIQRIGRSGHGVGQVSRGSFYPVHAHDFLEAAVIAGAVDSGDIETITPVESPLDVLSQVLLSMTLRESRSMDELYGEIRGCSSFHTLSRREFDLVIEMLAGRYADSRIRELRPRLMVDRIRNTARTRDNARTLLYRSGGVIPDRGYFNLRVADTKAKIGELDEEFVWERSLGDAFPLGNQIWRIVRVTHNDVEVQQVTKSNTIIPFWRAEDMNRSFHLSEKISRFLEDADARLKSREFRNDLIANNHMTGAAADFLIDYLSRQKDATGSLPHRRNLVIEHFRDPANVSDSKQTVLHTIWGGRLNRPLSLALSAAWEEKYGYPLEVFANNDCIMLNLPHDFSAGEILSLVEEADVPRLLRVKLESTGYFGAQFRENAQRALLLPRRSFHERMPLWMNRLRSKKLLEAVSRFEDFPVLLETWRTCMNYEFDLDTLDKLLGEIRTGDICLTEVETKITSPFAAGIIWRQTNYLMYADDTPYSKLRTSLSDELLEEILHSSHLRPRLPDALIRAFTEKVQRTAPGYAPGTPVELLEWVKERLLIPAAEWDMLLKAIERDHGLAREDIEPPVADSLYHIERNGEPFAVAALENIPKISRALGTDIAVGDSVAERNGDTFPVSDQPEAQLAEFIDEWLRFYGPVTHTFIENTLGVDRESLDSALQSLLDERRILIDEFRTAAGGGVPEEICESGNLEILLRWKRVEERPVFEPIELERLPLFLARHQGLTSPGSGIEDMQERLEKLFGYPARAVHWETDFLPSRLDPYYTSWLDSAMRESELIWFGCGNERTSFCFASDLGLFTNSPEDSENGSESTESGASSEIVSLLSRTPGRISFTDIISASKRPVDELADSLWDLAWRGKITNNDYGAVRKGILNDFHAPALPPGLTGGSAARRRRTGFNRWKNARPFSGNWYALRGADEDDSDALDRQEDDKDRIRQLFLRYGILFRELLRNEMPSLRWASIFRTLRLMELSGEILTGHFFKGISGLQFCSHAAFRELNVETLHATSLPDDAVYWMNAADPASLCGLGIEGLKGSIPPRLATTHLVYHTTDLVLVSRRNGSELDICVPPDGPRIREYLAFFHALLTRQFLPVKLIKTETVNDEPVLESPYRVPLQEFGFKRDYRALVLRKHYS